MFSYQRDCIALARDDERPSAAHHFARDNYDLALAGLLLRQPAVLAIGSAVLLFDVSAEIGAVNFNLASKFGFRLDRGPNRLPDFVSEHKCGFVLNAQVAGERQHAFAFDLVAENRDRAEVISYRQLPAGEDRAARHAELLLAGLTLPCQACRDRVDVYSAAARAERLTVVISEPDLDEPRVRFLIGQPKNLSLAQVLCGCGEEEVLHLISTKLVERIYMRCYRVFQRFPLKSA